MIKARNLTKIYHLYDQQTDRFKEALSLTKKKYHKDFYALKNVDFNISRGEIVGIIGRNGSGKSTLLKMLAGILTPSSGSIHVRGKINAMLELGAGFNPELTGIENIELQGALNGYNKTDMKDKIEDIKAFAEIGEFVYQAVKTYSSGMKARLAFAFAIHVDPEIMIIDEVLSVGDAAFQRKCFAKIESFREQGKTILFVSHSIGQVIELCHRVIWLHKGEKVIDGDTKLVAGLYEKYGMKNDLKLLSIQEDFLKMQSHKASQKKLKETSLTLFNSKLKPKSTIVYETNGAKISNVQILTKDYEKANILKQGCEYYYSYDVVFDKMYKEVNLAILLKTVTGFIIGGKEVPLVKNRCLTSIQPNICYNIKWKFKNILNSGNYFFNSGVNTIINDEKIILHRIIDAYMFKVLPKKDTLSNGIIDFNFNVMIEGTTHES